MEELLIRCISSFAFMLFTICTNSVALDRQKSFWLYDDGGTTYVVLHLSGGKAIMKEATIELDTLKINTNSNIYTSVKDKTCIINHSLLLSTSLCCNGAIESAELTIA